MATTPRVFIKRSSVVGKVPTSGSLNYGELAINFADGKLYYKDDSDNIRAFIDSARVQAIADAIEVVANAQLDSSEVTSLIDSSYVQARVPITYLQTLIDSAYVNLRADDYTGFDSDFNAKSTSDLSEGSNLYYTKTRVDSDIAASLNDSGNTVTITINNVIEDKVDSDYVLARVNEAPFLDSAAVIPIIDSHVDKAFVDALNVDADTLDGLNGAHYLNYQNFTNKPTILDTVDVSNIITTDVDKAFVDALNVDADTLDGYQAQYFIDKIDSNTAAMLDSAEAIALIDSAYVQLRQDYAYASLTGTPNVLDSADIQAFTLDSAEVIALIDSAYVQARQLNFDNLLDSAEVTSLVDSAYVQARQIAYNTSDFLDSSTVELVVDSAYVQARQITYDFLDSSEVIDLVDSAYVQARQIKYNTSDFTDSSFVTGLPVSTFTNDANYLDSTTVQPLLPKFGTDYIDSATVIDIINSEGLDSDLVIALVDSAYIQLRDRFQDSSLVTSTVDSSYIQIRVPESYLSTIIDSAYVNARVSSTDSIAVVQIIDSHVTQTFVNSLNIDADNLDGETGTFYLDYNNFSNTPTIPTLGNNFVDSNEVTTLIDSDYIELRRPAETIFNVTNSGASAYTFTGDGFSSGRNNPTLYLTRGKTYKFAMAASGHPFQIRVSNGGSAYSTGVTNNGAQTGDILFTPDMNAPNNLVYQCTLHSGMVGDIVIIDNNAFLDSATATSLIDSAYILARSPAGIDSDLVIQIIDSAYVQARQSGGEITIQEEGSPLSTAATTLNFVGSAVTATGSGTTKTITISQAEGGTDSATVSNIIITEVDSAYVQARQSSGLDSALVTQLVDSAYVAARTTAGTDSATVSSIITEDVDSDFIFNLIKIKASKKYYIQPNEPAIDSLGEYWYKSDSDILYKSVASTTITTTIPGYQLSSTVHYSKIYDWASNNPSSATRTNISGTDALGGSFTSGTTASAWFAFTASLSPPALNASADYDFDSPQDLRGIIIENSDPNAGRLERIDYENGDYADNGFPGGGTVTWYNSGGTALGKTANANTTGNTFVDISHPNGVKATGIGFSQVGDYYSGNDVFLFFAGNPIWQEIDRARTSSDLGLDSGAVTSLIDSAYIQARQSSGSGDGLDSALTIQLIDSAYVQARQTSGGGGTGTVDSAYVQSVVDSAVIPFTQEFYHFTADSGQLTFSGFDDDSETLSYTAGALAVYLNGILLVDSIDYTATNGTSVILQDSAEVGDILTVLKFGGNTTGIDSTAVIALIDSAYIQARQSSVGTGGLDSALTTQLIDSAYVQARQSSGLSDIVDDTTPQLGGHLDGNGYDIFLDDDDILAWGASPGRTNIQGKASTSYSSNYIKFNVRSGLSQSSEIAKLTEDDGIYTTIGLNLPNWNTALNDYYDLKIKGPTSNSLVANETIRFPDSSGTVALTKDVLDSAAVIRLITANAIDSGVALQLLLDSIETIALIDSDYVKLRVTKSDLDMEGNKVLFANVYSAEGDLPSASTYHGMFAHVHATGAGYFAHAGNWIQLANQSSLPTLGNDFVDSGQVTTLIDSSYVQLRQSAATNIDSIGAIGNVNAIGATEGQILKFDSATQKFILATDATGGGGSGGLDSALVTQLIDSAYVQARQTSGGGAGGLDSALVSQLIDSAYIGTKVDFTRGEFVNEKSQYTATASQTVFNHSSIDPTHLDVYLNGVLQVVDDDYTATSSAVTFTSGVDSGYSVTIVEKRGRVLTQRGLVNTKYYFTTATPTTSITGTDDNGLTLDYSVGNLDVYLNGILLKDSDDYSTNGGTTVTLTSATDSSDLVTLVNTKGVVVTPNVKNYEYTATAGQLTFSGADINSQTLAYVPDAIQVYLNGILLRNVDYTAVNGTSITLADSASLNDELVVSAFSNPGQNMDLYKFTADSGQTIFNGNDLTGASLAYNPGNIQVFMNGLLLNDSDDYTASNGMSVVLTEAANINDEIKIASFVANTTTLRTNAWSAPTESTVQATAGDKLFIDVSSSAKTVTLPSSATMGDEIRIIDVTGYAATNNITVGRNGHKIQGSASDLTININRAGIGLVYYNTAQGWILIEN